ncbi:FeoA family protein [Williamsia sp. CHRR-6]|uniref:FeoA family protein n=1 Tax=Williamsia sp. CHRR-6 TaxID=2835871 RepID=UPI001BD91815|nr:FeoA family protein [Williamsia sp. CHRR-6]MBT0567602.1 ferrous iron transport protein A [Williamsia sp. CHRR-6]
MSLMTEQLGNRTMVEPAELDRDVMSVADLRPGQRARVTRLCADADAATARRYFDLGFTPGALIIAQRRALLRGPVVLRVAGYDVALRRAQASCIKVEVLDH